MVERPQKSVFQMYLMASNVTLLSLREIFSNISFQNKCVLILIAFACSWAAHNLFIFEYLENSSLIRESEDEENS